MSFFSGPVARNTLGTAVIFGIRLLALAVQLLLVARLLGPAGFSHYVAAGGLSVVLGGLSTFGVHLLVLKAAARGSPAPMLAMALGTWRLLCLPFFLLYLVLCQLLGMLQSNLWLVVGLGLAEIFVQPLLQLLAMLIQGRGEVAIAQCWLAAPMVLRAILLLPLLLLGSDVDAGFVVGSVQLVAVVVCTLAMYCWGNVAISRWSEWRVLARGLWGEAGSFALLSITAGGQAELDKLLSVRMLTAGPAGVYTAAARIAGAAILPVVALLVSALPRLFGHQRWDWKLLRLLSLSAVAYAVVGAVMLWFLSPWLELAFGGAYQGLAGVLAILSLALPAQALRLVVVNVLMAKGAALWRGGIELGVMLVLLVSTFVIAVDGRAASMAWAVVACEWIALCLLVVPVIIKTLREHSL